MSGEGPVGSSEAKNETADWRQHDDDITRDSESIPTDERILLDHGASLFAVYGVDESGCQCGEIDCNAQGKHPHRAFGRGGYKSATRSRERLNAFRRNVPGCNLAMATGAVSGFFVIDLDQRHGGYDSFDRWADEHMPEGLPNTLRVLTGDGQHLYFRQPFGMSTKNGTNLLPGVDLRGDKGYVVVPPSMHRSGRRYRFVDREAPIADPPEQILQLITRRGTGERGRPQGPIGPQNLPPLAELRVAGFKPGQRDDGFYVLACSLVRKHYPHRGLIEGVLREVWEATPPGDHPFTWEDALGKLQGAWDFVAPQVEAQRGWARELGGDR